jgi:hypothetical protein
VQRHLDQAPASVNIAAVKLQDLFELAFCFFLLTLRGKAVGGKEMAFDLRLVGGRTHRLRTGRPALGALLERPDQF